MKHMFKRILGGVLAFAFGCSAAGAGALEWSLSYGGCSSDITIDGTSAVAKSGRSITLQIIKEGTDLNDIAIPSSAEEAILYTRKAFTDADGNFSFKLNLSQTGIHKIRISDNGETVDAAKTICVSTDAALADALSDLSAAKGNPTLADLIISSDSSITPGTKVYDILQINKAEYDSLKADSAFLANLSSKVYADFDSFNKQYKLSKLLVDISNAANGEAIYNLLNSDPSPISFDGKNAGVVFEEYADTEKKSALNSLAGKHYGSVSDVQSALWEAVIVKEIASADTYQTKYDAISSNNDCLSLDTSKLSNLGTYIESFKDELSKKDLSSVAKIRTAYDEVYLKYYNLNQQGGSKPGPGTSSTGSSSSSSFVGVDTGLVSGSQSAFNDIYSVPWATEAIESLAAKGVISGKADGIFAPLDNVTRAEFVKILVGAFGLENSSANASFVDVPASHWAYSFIASASSKGIVNGVGAGTFGTNMNITRQDIVALCYRLAQSQGVSFTPSGTFADEAQIADYAKEAAASLKAAGIISGKGNDVFDPTAFATRAEATKIIYQLMLYCGK